MIFNVLIYSLICSFHRLVIMVITAGFHSSSSPFQCIKDLEPDFICKMLSCLVYSLVIHKDDSKNCKHMRCIWIDNEVVAAHLKRSDYNEKTLSTSTSCLCSFTFNLLSVPRKKNCLFLHLTAWIPIIFGPASAFQ